MRYLLLLPGLALVLLLFPSFVKGYTTVGATWGTTTVRYYVNPKNKYVSESAAVSAIQSAAAPWRDQTRANVELAYAGYTSGSSVGMNYKSEVFFRDGTSGGNAAEGYYWYDGSGKIVDGDVVFYEGAYQFFAGSGCANGIYIENIGVHEFGHVLGLGHSDVAGATMAPAMQSYCERAWLTLESDDIAGIEKLYQPVSGSTPTNTAPSVSIASPGNNASYAEGATITFSGSAGDSQDGNVTSDLRWTSNLVGQIGTGGSFSRTLSAGIHSITASVTDSGGLSASKLVTVTVTANVTAPAPGGASLTARGYKVKGMQKADLAWTGLTATSVDVYRSGAIVTTTANDGNATDPIDKKGNGSYTYKVCAAGTSTCSNAVSVAF
jgi:hypothetical protein